ncbi:iron chelate uptake ABC transporter family permease subunit [Seminibacterium arietis]|uniref:Iron chelate uptake ABC transporter family permease subunit n=1 Tax=Seminibacterium arietis TaxID=1173502 RepID=A0ABW3I902_9PAST
MKKRKNYHNRIIILLILTALSVTLYLFYGLPKRWEYALNSRILTLSAIVVTGLSLALATMIFQTIVNNRILTPSILGLDNLYLLIQVSIIFVFGSNALAEIKSIWLFAVCTGAMILFALLLYYFLFNKSRQNIFFLLLVGIVFGTFFQSMTTFMEVLIDPNEFQIAQDIGFASFNNINIEILWVSIVILLCTTLYTLRYIRYFDVLSLGRDHAINLGINYQQISKRLLVAVAILISVSTALVGPLTFLGLLVMNLTFEFIRTYRHSILIPSAMLISVITLVFGQFLASQVFTFGTTLSIIVNFVGGSYFVYLLLRANKKWQ